MSGSLKYEFYSSVQRQDVEWLWYPYIPYGKLTIVQGDPGEGKSSFVINLLALASRGEPMPDGYEIEGPVTSVYQCSEDDVADTIKPRLLAAGADCSRVAYIVDDQVGLTLADDRIEEVLDQTGARILVLDPIQSFLAQDGDMQSASRMRTLLGNLAEIAARQRCAIILVGHLTKASGGKRLYRGLGSIDIAATARSVLLISRSRSDEQLRFMKPIKSSLAPEGPGMAFSFVEGNFQWRNDVDLTLMADDHGATGQMNREQVVQRMTDLLSERDYVSTEILGILLDYGVPRRTAFRAKQDAGIETYRVGNTCYWRLPKEEEQGDVES